jgi:CxxC-x17-CxxC domain-containing protein
LQNNKHESKKMKDFKRKGKFGQGGFKKAGGGGFGGPKRRDSGAGGFEKKLYDATCDNCGNACQVPFRPSGGKPVYCRDCYRAMGGGEEQTFDRGHKMDSGERRHGKHFSHDRHPGHGGPGELKNDLERISAKLDRILRILEGE